ncbi:MAG TPA: ribosome maturation factor RimP [Saprospiraceae bacterium]|nr:ribosome maturation factor RimP [Saprospiraceae bacterium]HHH55389.1 ribosome maturation factor RimP [Bacteroidota bacterium]
MSIINKISEVVSQKLSEDGFEDCYIVEIKIDQNSKVRVFVDCDSGVPIRKCVSISRRVEHFLDETLLLGEKYTLEVSSPGIDRPLIKRQFKKNIGRDLKVILNNDKKIKGTLNFVDTNGIILNIKEKKITKQEEIKFSDIKEAKVIVKFNKNKK